MRMDSERRAMYFTDRREKVEEDLIFIGLVVMENRLKPQTEGNRKAREEPPSTA
jgi:magnesium-transporting ATPase (P-type)